MNQILRKMILWGLIGGIAVSVGCNSSKPYIVTKLPEIHRPELVPITLEEWNSIPGNVREKLLINQKRIFKYVLQLETIIKKANKIISEKDLE